MKSPTANRRDLRASVGDRPLPIRFHDFDLSSSRSNERFRLAGSFFYAELDAFDSETVLSSTLTAGNMFVRFGSPSSLPVLIKPGRTYEMPAVDEIFVTNSAQASKMLRLNYSMGAIIDPNPNELTITGGLNINNFADLLLADDQAGYYTTNAVNAVAAKYSYAHNFNPVASGFNVYITHAQWESEGATRLSIRAHNTSLANAASEHKKSAASAVAAAIATTENLSAHPGSEIGFPGGSNTGIPVIWRPRPAIHLAEGAGIAFGATTVNLDLPHLFEWIEVAI